MLRYSHVATYFGLNASLVSNITDLQTFAGPSGYTLYSITHIGGGFAAFAITSAQQPIQMIDSRPHSSWAGYAGSPTVALVELGGEPALFGAGLINGMGLGTLLNSGGGFGAVAQLQGANRLAGDVILLGQFETPQGEFLYSVRNGQTAFDTWRVGENGSVSFVGRSQLPWGDGMPGTEISDMEVVRLADRSFMVSVSALGNYVAAQMLNANGTAGGATMLWADRGLGLNQPSHLTTVTVGSVTYVVVASAQSSSLTTLRLTYSGELLPSDHIIDELTTRFRGATALDSVTINGRAFVFVGGGDDGISVFTLTPDGRLLHLVTLADADDRAMADVSALTAEVIDGQIVLFVASQTERGITQLVFDPGQTGITSVTGEGRQDGTSGNDMMLGGPGTRALVGGDGDDILIAGYSALTMVGGAGADTFVAREVNGHIIITDFTPGEDALDLSLLGMIRSIWQLEFRPQADGIKIQFGNTTIVIKTADGQTLQASYFDNSLFPVAHYGTPNMRTNILGTQGHDTLTAGAYGSAITGLGGNDQLLGGDGADFLNGGAGRDTLSGGGGNDTVHGGDDVDIIRGHAGDDRLVGNGGNDGMYGGLGNDTIQGDAGNDVLVGEEGDDHMTDLIGHNALWAANGNDLLHTGGGNDTLSGGAGNDTMNANQGQDTMTGGDGNDWMYAAAGDDTLDGGSGNDTLYGGIGNDRMDGGTGNDILDGDQGNDWMLGMSGNDTLSGRDGHDVLLAHGGHDSMRGGSGNDILYGAEGNDSLMGEGGNDSIYAGLDADTVYGGSGNDLLDGGDGNDFMVADGGDDTVRGGTGHDTIWAMGGHMLLSGGDGNDNILAFGGNDVLYGEAGDDTLAGGDGRDRLYGGLGADLVSGDAGDDRLFGDAGDDRIRGGAGNDVMNGAAGNDRMDGGAGSDLMIGGVGRDVFHFVTRESFDRSRDTIQGYTLGEDVIDMTGLNLTFIGDAAFSGTGSGQVRTYTTAEAGRVLAVDLDGDGLVDLTISIGSAGSPTDSDLLL